VASVIPSAPLGTDATAGRPSGLGAAPGTGPDRTSTERRFRFELAAHPGSPAQARRLVRARLTGWSVCEDTCDAAVLVISELVTNAIVHTAGGVVVCELHDSENTLRIAVRDEGCTPGEPRPSPQLPEEEHGRGLLLVDALCRAWGAQEHGPGLLVWAELPRDGSEPCGDLGWGTRPKPEPSDGTEPHEERPSRATQSDAPRSAEERVGPQRGPQPLPAAQPPQRPTTVPDTAVPSPNPGRGPAESAQRTARPAHPVQGPADPSQPKPHHAQSPHHAPPRPKPGPVEAAQSAPHPYRPLQSPPLPHHPPHAHPDSRPLPGHPSRPGRQHAQSPDADSTSWRSHPGPAPAATWQPGAPGTVEQGRERGRA